MTAPAVTAIGCPLGRSSVVFAYHVAAPEPVLIDCGHHRSPAEAILPALRTAGIEPRAITAIVATHGHADHIGGAAAMRDAIGGDVPLLLHPADEPLLHDVDRHLHSYSGFRFRYVDEPAERERFERDLRADVGTWRGRVEPLRDGQVVDLGGGCSLTVVAAPGHSPGCVLLVLEPGGVVFAADAIQGDGSAGQLFPLIERPRDYAASMRRLLEDLEPGELRPGHRYRLADGTTLDHAIPGEQARQLVAWSVEVSDRIAAAVERVGARPELPEVDWLATLAPAVGQPPEPAAWRPSYAPTMLAHRREVAA